MANFAIAPTLCSVRSNGLESSSRQAMVPLFLRKVPNTKTSVHKAKAIGKTESISVLW